MKPDLWINRLLRNKRIFIFWIGQLFISITCLFSFTKILLPITRYLFSVCTPIIVIVINVKFAYVGKNKFYLRYLKSWDIFLTLYFFHCTAMHIDVIILIKLFLKESYLDCTSNFWKTIGETLRFMWRAKCTIGSIANKINPLFQDLGFSCW